MGESFGGAVTTIMRLARDVGEHVAACMARAGGACPLLACCAGYPRMPKHPLLFVCNRVCNRRGPHPAGFDTDHGRLDVSVHPFTGGAHPTDVRMTTRFKAHDLTEGLTGAAAAAKFAPPPGRLVPECELCAEHTRTWPAGVQATCRTAEG